MPKPDKTELVEERQDFRVNCLVFIHRENVKVPLQALFLTLLRRKMASQLNIDFYT